MNPSDFFLQSVLPLERMFRDGAFDKGIKYMPVLDGLQQPKYFQWWLSPFTSHMVWLRSSSIDTAFIMHALVAVCGSPSNKLSCEVGVQCTHGCHLLYIQAATDEIRLLSLPSLLGT